MKIRTDFVTNSSSSSFILAQKGELSQEQKDALIDLIESWFYGRDTMSTIEELNAYAKDNYLDEDDWKYVEMKNAIESGKTIYGGWVVFEDASYDLADIYQSVWKTIRKHSHGNFEIIDGDLSY